MKRYFEKSEWVIHFARNLLAEDLLDEAFSHRLRPVRELSFAVQHLSELVSALRLEVGAGVGELGGLRVFLKEAHAAVGEVRSELPVGVLCEVQAANLALEHGLCVGVEVLRAPRGDLRLPLVAESVLDVAQADGRLVLEGGLADEQLVQEGELVGNWHRGGLGEETIAVAHFFGLEDFVKSEEF